MHGPPYVHSKMCVIKKCKLLGLIIRKAVALAIFCVFWPLWPPGNSKIIYYSAHGTGLMCIFKHFNFLESFREIERMVPVLWGKINNFGNFGSIFDPFDPPGFKNQTFQWVKSTYYMLILTLFYFLKSYRKI